MEDKLNGVEVPDNAKLQVHIVPHSHDDVGFKKTLDQYFTGSGDMIVRAGVQYVLGNLILSFSYLLSILSYLYLSFR